MSLNFQLSNIEEWQQVCYHDYDVETEIGPTGQVIGGRRLKGVTEHLIWMCMIIEMRGITAKDAGEFWARLQLAYGLDASTHLDVHGMPIRAMSDDVLSHIGLSTNVGQSTRHAWITRKDGQVWNRMDEFKSNIERMITLQEANVGG